MRNTEYRKIVDKVAELVNNGIQSGIEPLALATALRHYADQCDRLAEQFEKQEQEEQAKEQLKEVAEAMDEKDE